MRPHHTTILFVDSFTTVRGGVPNPSSDAIGYGITAARALRRGLRDRGYQVVRPDLHVAADPSDPGYRTAWTIACYDGIRRAVSARTPDLIMCFHAFGAFPAEIRRMVLDLGKRVPIIGYTHGSHWDPTDRFRTDRYPGMELVDLANLHVMQCVLLVSEYMRATVLDHVRAFRRELADDLERTMAVIGLPIDTDLIDACRDAGRSGQTTIVYNHAPIESKQPALFLDAVADILEDYDVTVLLTRSFPDDARLRALEARFGRRIVRGDDLPLAEYYRRLWLSDIQVSTATHESLGVATLEAMCTENYCIAPRIGSYPEILGDGYEGMYDGSRTELVLRLRSAIADPGRRERKARELSRLARRYRPEVVTDKLTAVIESVLAETA